MKIKVSCECKDFLALGELTEFQGGLKSLREKRLMELDPHYCDVIRRRYTKWAKENGKPITSGCLE